MERRTTKITRSWGATIGYLVGAAAALVISILLFMTIAQGPVTLGIALMPAIGGMIFICMSFGGSGKSTCPGCQSRLTGLSTKSNDGVLCGGCNHYLEANGGSLWQTDENRISDVPLFSSPLPAQFSFPGGCCVCGRSEAGLEKISLSNQNASSAITAPSVGVTTSTIVSVEVPHCAEHKEGAQLTGTPQRPHIKFRSYPYLRAFCESNGTTPG